MSFHAALVIDGRVMLLREQGAAPITEFTTPEAVVLDREFWLGLGEALQWKKEDLGQGYAGWAHHAHRFLDLMLLGEKGAERFWAEILARKPKADRHMAPR